MIVNDTISFCWLDEQLLAYNTSSGDTHLLEGDAAWLISTLSERPLTNEQVHQLHKQRDSNLQFPLSRLIMNLESIGIIRVRDANSGFAAG